MSDGGNTSRLTSLAANCALAGFDTGVRPLSFSICCSTTLWIEYQNGMATVLPPSCFMSVMSGATVRPEPPTWFHATTLAGTLLP